MIKKDTPRPETEEDINDFLKQVELVESSTYLKNRNSNISHPIVKLEYQQGKEVKVTTQGIPERESIESFLMRIRPLVVYEEELYIGKVATYVFEGKGLVAEDRLRLYRTCLARRRLSLFSVKIDGLEYSMWDFVWLHLYGKYFHLEREKRCVLKKLEGTFGPLTEATSLGNLEIYATIAIFLARDILAMRADEPFDKQPTISAVK